MPEIGLRLTRFHRVGAAVHAVALSGDGEHLLVGSEQGLHLMDRRGNVRYRLNRDGQAFNGVALSPGFEAGLAMERAGRLYRLDFKQVPAEQRTEPLAVAAVGIWEQRDDLYSLDFAPHAGGEGSGLIALGHHALGLTALDGRGQLLWRLGPREGLGPGFPEHETKTGISLSRRSHASAGQGEPAVTGRTWHAAISADGRTIYAAALGRGAEQSATRSPRGPRQSHDHQVVAIDAALGKPVRAFGMDGRVTLLAGLPAPLAVAAVHQAGEGGSACCRVTALEAGLRREAWSLACPPNMMITAIASAPHHAALIVGTNAGELWRVGAFTGRILARYDLLYASAVLSIAVAETGEIVAGLANGHIAFLERVKDEQAEPRRQGGS